METSHFILDVSYFSGKLIVEILATPINEFMGVFRQRQPKQ
ncbi:hypothetical protein SAMN04515625_0565 [Methanohalophilus halophilus]|uniref:Uncharacterized protein n=2 Tax=Methanohalophilus halophilus TaxID=2177 RepID=A0A1H2S730_9EURY|nr:hypothetical protein SAMN04515625_0565 [Methanohalophilus halophilus]